MDSSSDISFVVEPLIDSVSDLVLSAVTSNFQNVHEICQSIADRTNRLVKIAHEAAVSSTDNETQQEVAGAINQLASAIELLVVSFTEILANNNERTQEGLFFILFFIIKFKLLLLLQRVLEKALINLWLLQIFHLDKKFLMQLTSVKKVHDKSNQQL